jgi:hypothetical protein
MTMTETTLKACDEYIRAARDVLAKIKYLTPDDRMRLEGGINYLERGRDLFKNLSPEAQEAAGLWLIGAFHLGAIVVVSTSEKKFWDLKSHGPGGKKGSKKRRRKMQEWNDHAREILAGIRRNNPTLKPDALATKILEKWEAIVPAPEHDTLTKFIREELKSAELKSIAAQKGPRLVQG